MKKSAKITICAISAALAASFMLTSYFPYLTLAVPGIAGLFMLMPLVEVGKGYAFLTYFVSACIVLITAEPEAACIYVCFLGYYPILKSIIERLKSRVLEWVLKMVVLNIAVFVIYLATTFVFGIEIEDLGEFGKYSAYILIAVTNVVFVMYDIAVSRIGLLYMIKIHPLVRKIGKH